MSPDLVSRIVPHGAQTAPDAIALVEGERRWTYRELARAIDSVAERLSRAHVRAGDRVVLVCENCCAAVALYLACTTVGAWPVVLGSRLTAHEIEEIRKHSGARLVIVAGGPPLRGRMQTENSEFESTELFAGGSVLLGRPDWSAQTEPAAKREPENVAALIYTTGTTGSPKGVMLTHANLMFVARASAAARRLSSDDRLLAVLPISHILGLTGVLLGGLLSGAEIHLRQRFDPDSLLTALERDRLSALIGTPAMYAMLCEYATRKGRTPKAPALRLISTAGAPLDPATKAATQELFGQPLHNGYGMTECSPTITLTDIDSPREDCSVGRLLPGLETRLVDSSGRKVAEGEPGELWVRGPGVMKGYYLAPEETAQAIDPDGWFRTGDHAREADGNYYIVGRCKEMVIRFGYKIYPAEIEGVLNAHPEVSCSAVVSRGAGSAEDIFAYVKLREGSPLAAADLSSFVASRLAPYKRPSKFVVVDRMPLSATGKILKSELAGIPPV
ncbi:MAG: class I adenylate-forming enzyme family protein [Rhizomicrobium sp.]